MNKDPLLADIENFTGHAAARRERRAVVAVLSSLSLLLLVFFCFLVVGCSHDTFTDGTARASMTNFGSNKKAARIQVGGILIEGWEDNATPALQSVLATVEKAWKGYLVNAGLKFVAGKYYDQQGKVLAADQTAKLEKLRNAKSAADADNALKVLQANHAAEAAAAAAPATLPAALP